MSNIDRLDTADDGLVACPFSDFGCRLRGSVEQIKKHMKEGRDSHFLDVMDGVRKASQAVTDFEKICEQCFLSGNDLIQRMRTIDALFSGQFVWRITDYTGSMESARLGRTPVIFSQAFHSHRYGYKLAAAIALYGDGHVGIAIAAIGETNSVFITILRGEYDGVLKWPFTCPVTFTMINQKVIGQNIVLTMIPKVNENNMIFIGRPKSERNAAFGLRTFVDLKLMKVDGDFVRNNCCFIRVDVDISNIQC